MKTLKHVALCMALALSVAACGTTKSAYRVDSSERVTMDTSLTLQDFRAMATKLTDRMLDSDVFLDRDDRVKLVVARISNRTDDDRIRVRDVHEEIVGYLTSTEEVLVKDVTSDDFEYVMQTVLTSTRQTGDDGAEFVTYRLAVKLTDLDGSLIGRWTTSQSMGKSAKPLI